jgi:hypothetical protein
METDNLIRVLAADQRGLGPPLRRQFALAILIGFAMSAVLFWITLGPREDIADAVSTVRFDLKIVQSLLLAATAAALLFRLAQPGADTRRQNAIMAAAPALLFVSIIAELLLVPAKEWLPSLVGENSLDCLASIPFLSLPLLAATFLFLRRGAPLRPALAGAIAGLLAGGLAAALYAVKCTDDSPLFVAVWYSIAIGAVSILGAVLGARLLRW